MQDGWGNGGEEMSLSTSHWDSEDADMWNNSTSQDSGSSCNSWSKKGLNKVRILFNTLVKEFTPYLLH